jgi:uncharacterized protein YebE (UPF0316 family)
MNEILLANSAVYAWAVIPFLIFIARIADVSLGTVRVIFISRGMKYFAPAVGFFEVLIWLLAIGQIMKNLSNPLCYVAYAGGFAMGNFVGICIAEKLSLGVVLLRVVTEKEDVELVQSLSSASYGVTSVEGRGAHGKVRIIFTIIPRKEITNAVGLVKKFNSKAFYTIEEIGFVEKGIFPARRTWLPAYNLWNFFRPLLRKGK